MTDDILAEIRARYGIMPKEARDHLGELGKSPKKMLYKIGNLIHELVEVAYLQQSLEFRTETELATFSGAIHHTVIQQHPLSTLHQTISEAVRILGEFLRVEKQKPLIN